MEAMRELGKKETVLIAFGAFTLVWALFVAPPGHYVIDEGIYHMMVDAVPWSGGLVVWNGYQEFPSPELDLVLTYPYDGELVPQYPYLSAFLYYPFYFVLGLRGLVVANALAAVATLWLTYRLTRVAFGDRQLALNACLILALATYFWEYSQAMWPQAIATAILVGSVYLVFRAFRAEGGRRAIGLAGAAGAVIGLGAGVRLDVVFVVPALVLPFLFARPWRPWPALAVLAGLIPGLLVLAATNEIKFGVFTPFAYSASEDMAKQRAGTYAVLALFGLAGTLVAWLLRHGLAEQRGGAWRYGSLMAAGAISVAVLSMPSLWQVVQDVLAGAHRLVIDFRIPPEESVPGGAVRGPGLGIFYFGSIKKSLLQSCPYLPLIGLLAPGLFRGGQHRAAIWLLALAPAGLMGVYAWQSWHGGAALNMRYFVPTLPFLAILAALAWKESSIALTGYTKQTGAVALAVSALAVAGLSAGVLLVEDGDPTLAYLEHVFLDLPLAIAILVAAVTLIKLAGRARSAWNRVGMKSAQIDAILAGVLAVAVAWSLLIVFASDYVRVYQARAGLTVATKRLETLIRRDSLVVAASPHVFFPLIVDRHVRVAIPWRDAYQNLVSLVSYHMAKGRVVYLWINEISDESKIREAPWTAFSYERIAEEPEQWWLFRMRRNERMGAADDEARPGSMGAQWRKVVPSSDRRTRLTVQRHNFSRVGSRPESQ